MFFRINLGTLYTRALLGTDLFQFIMQLRDTKTKTAIKRQIPFLIGGTITGIILTFYLGFPLTFLANSILWFVISLICYKFVWKTSGVSDQKYLLKYFLTKVNRRGFRRGPVNKSEMQPT